jgi:hypothetical protein
MLRTNLPLYAERCLKLRTTSGELKPFHLNRIQRFLDAKINDQLGRKGKVRLLVLKGRKQGVSTYLEARMLWRVAMNDGLRAIVMTHEQAASNNLFDMSKRYFDHLPERLKPHLGASNEKELFFDRLDSAMEIATAGNKSTGRSATFQLMHGSEAAYWPHAESHMSGMGQTIADIAGTEIYLETTANGVGNPFHTRWVKAKEGNGDWETCFIPWFWSDEYSRPVPEGFSLSAEETDYRRAYNLTLEQMAWRRAKMEGDFAGKPEMFSQEYPATDDEAFLNVGHDPFISPLLVLRAVANGTSPMTASGALVVGVDPARFGPDKSAIVRRRGRVVDKEIERIEKRDLMHLVGRIAVIIRDEHPVKVFIDVGGLGAGAYDRLVELGFGHIVVAVNFGESAHDEIKYRNRRAEMWGEMEKWLRDGPVSIPNDSGLIGDLSGPTFKYDSNGRLLLESKDDMRGRGVKSPDAGDALALTFAMPVAALHQAAIQPTFAEAMAELGVGDLDDAMPWLR